MTKATLTKKLRRLERALQTLQGIPLTCCPPTDRKVLEQTIWIASEAVALVQAAADSL